MHIIWDFYDLSPLPPHPAIDGRPGADLSWTGTCVYNVRSKDCDPPLNGFTLEAITVKTKSSINFFDIDAITSVLEIARTASYQVELSRLMELAIRSSSPKELTCKHFVGQVASAYRGCFDDSAHADMLALSSDWEAVGGDLQSAFDNLALESDVVALGLGKRLKNLQKTRMSAINECEKRAL